jgi:hypothetical protein
MISMKDGESLIDRLAQRRAQAESAAGQGVANAAAPAAAPATVPQPIEALTEAQTEASTHAALATPLAMKVTQKAGLLRWVAVILVALVGFALFTWVVGSRDAVPSNATSTAKQVKGVPVTAPPTPAVTASLPPVVTGSEPVTNSSVPDAAITVARVTTTEQPAKARPAMAPANGQSALKVPAQASRQGKQSVSGIRETVTPLPVFVEQPSEPVAPAQTTSIFTARAPAPQLAPVPSQVPNEPANLACQGLNGLELRQCNVCNDRTALVRGFCREQVRLAYCEGRFGKDLACPLTGYAKGF